MIQHRCLLALAAIALVGARHAAANEPLGWMASMAECYDAGVHQNRAIVVLFYDKTRDRTTADLLSTRFSLSPRSQALADQTVWCLADISSDVVAANIGKALKVSTYPTVSVLWPNPNVVDEAVRVVGEMPFFATEDYVFNGIRKVRTEPTESTPRR